MKKNSKDNKNLPSEIDSVSSSKDSESFIKTANNFLSNAEVNNHPNKVEKSSKSTLKESDKYTEEDKRIEQNLKNYLLPILNKKYPSLNDSSIDSFVNINTNTCDEFNSNIMNLLFKYKDGSSFTFDDIPELTRLCYEQYNKTSHREDTIYDIVEEVIVHFLSAKETKK